MPGRCRRCGGSKIRSLGVGTQKVVEEAAALLPGVRIERWDADATRSGLSAEEAMESSATRRNPGFGGHPVGGQGLGRAQRGLGGGDPGRRWAVLTRFPVGGAGFWPPLPGSGPGRERRLSRKSLGSDLYPGPLRHHCRRGTGLLRPCSSGRSSSATKWGTRRSTNWCTWYTKTSTPQCVNGRRSPRHGSCASGLIPRG